MMLDSLWAKKIAVGDVDVLDAERNRQLVAKIEDYESRVFFQNEHGFTIRKSGPFLNFLSLLDDDLHDWYMSMVRKAFASYMQEATGKALDDLDLINYSVSGSSVRSGEVTMPHVDHGCQLVFVYFPHVARSDKEPTQAGSLVFFDSAFGSAADLGGAHKGMFSVTPVTGTFLVFPAVGSVHMHTPTFFKESIRYYVDTFISFYPKGRMPRTVTALKDFAERAEKCQ